jgi:hypothetical protein
MNYFITLAIQGDLHKQEHDMVVAIKEAASQHFEQYGVVRSVRVHEYEPQRPKQLTFKDIEPKPPKPAPAAKKTAKKFVPPTLAEVKAYAAERRAEGKGMPDDDAEQWFYARGRGDWTYGTPPKPLANWKLDFCACEKNIAKWKTKEQKPKGTAFHSPDGPSYDLAKHERDTLVVPVFNPNE